MRRIRKKASSSSQTLAQDQFSVVNFANLNPADPVSAGFVADASRAGLSGVTVELYNVAQNSGRHQDDQRERFLRVPLHGAGTLPRPGGSAARARGAAAGDARRQDVRRGGGRLQPREPIARCTVRFRPRGPPADGAWRPLSRSLAPSASNGSPEPWVEPAFSSGTV